MGNIKATAILLIVVLASGPFAKAVQTAGAKKPTIKEQVVMIPTGTVIEVKLLQKGSSKIKGKLLSVTDDGFEVQSAKSDKVSSQKVAFADVMSVKAKNGMSKTVTILIWVGVAWLAVGIVAATTVNR